MLLAAQPLGKTGMLQCVRAMLLVLAASSCCCSRSHHAELRHAHAFQHHTLANDNDAAMLNAFA